MRIIYRDIVGGFIFSKDGKLLLGKNRKGGVYEGQFVVPAGGSEVGETKEETLYREIKEETGIDITDSKVSSFLHSLGESEKTLPDTGERVLVKMNFYDYRIDLNSDADKVSIATNSDWSDSRWFDINELNNEEICQPTLQALVDAGIVKTP